MAGITLAKAEEQLEKYLAAEVKVLAGQKVVLDGVDMTRANLEAIQKGIEIWNERVSRLSASAAHGGRIVRRVVPL